MIKSILIVFPQNDHRLYGGCFQTLFCGNIFFYAGIADVITHLFHPSLF